MFTKDELEVLMELAFTAQYTFEKECDFDSKDVAVEMAFRIGQEYHS